MPCSPKVSAGASEQQRQEGERVLMSLLEFEPAAVGQVKEKFSIVVLLSTTSHRRG